MLSEKCPELQYKMTEYVEISLEKLLPVFENIRAIELLPADELAQLIKECRRHEYSIAKQTKNPADYIAYANYLAEVIEYIEDQRKATRQFLKYDKIDKKLKYKCAFLHRICSDRFKKIEYFRDEVAYAKRANILGVCSQAYTRFLQFHGYDPRIHEEAGRFEFFTNRSADNSRTIFQAALRKFPNDVDLWVALFEMEMEYVKYLVQRKEKLIGSKEDGKGTKRKLEEDTLDIVQPSDEVMDMKLAKIVCDQALKTVAEEMRSELAHKLWAIAESCESLSTDLKQTLEEAVKKYRAKPIIAQQSAKSDNKADEQSLGFWEELIDSALEMGSLKKVEKIFKKAFIRACPSVAAQLKTVRLNILNETGSDPEDYRQAYRQMAAMLPTSVTFHLRLVELEEEQLKPDLKLIETAFENALIEFGQVSVDCWIRYLKFLLKSAPAKVGSVHARAFVNLSADLVEKFNEEWIKVMTS
uniref:U3 small nucleolar RNA-associated protein 6 n=1 Tax=Ditylenchus dipsaci TaxID=166011 RepID=A0A915CXE6_9BILA